MEFQQPRSYVDSTITDTIFSKLKVEKFIEAWKSKSNNEAHNGFSAKIVKNSGFLGIWGQVCLYLQH